MGNLIRRLEKLELHVRPDLGAKFNTTMERDRHGHIRIIPIVGIFRTDKHIYKADQLRNNYICYLDDTEYTAYRVKKKRGVKTGLN